MNVTKWLRWWPALLLVACALVPAAHAATTELNIQLGDTFSGSINTAGVDTVNARFNAVQDTVVSVSVRSLSSLQPTVVLKDASGAAIGLGEVVDVDEATPSQGRGRDKLKRVRLTSILLGERARGGGSAKQARITNFVIPASGNYTIEVGGTAGSGAFTARTKGRFPNKVGMTTLSGTVTNSLTGGGIPGAGVTVGPYFIVADLSGNYTEELPVGDYGVTFEAQYFVTENAMVTLLPRVDADLDAALDPVAPVIVMANVSGSAAPGAMLTAAARVVVLDGSTITGYAWSQPFGTEAMIGGSNTETATVTLAGLPAYKETLFHILAEPPVGADELPPNVPLPPGEFPGGLQDRFQVVGPNPFALEETGLIALKVDVTTTSGTYHDDVELHTVLPWKPAAGIRNVAIGVPVLLHGKDQTAYDWALTPPGASGTVLMDPVGQNPMFVPDVPGLYEAEVTDEASGAPVTLEVWAGTWRGVIVDQDADGRPVASGDCTGCHSGFAPDVFTPWAQTGHAEIFTNNLNTSTHYGSNCFPCHTVGYDPDVQNGGIDEASDYGAFLGAGLLNNPGDNWTTVLVDFPETAQLANIQCENCHGPQSAGRGLSNPAHAQGTPRVSISSDVCAVCHGEPLRHARFQQWQLSAHANYELAIDEGDSGNCSRCHTGNGFLAWLPVLLGDAPGDPLDSISVNWTRDETHPQTCVTCHDPHAIGTTSGNDTNASVYISGDTPPLIAGFTAIGVGKGAMCMTCHNSRRGLRNDGTFDEFFGTAEAARAPHGSAQTDVLMGENAYLIGVGVRGAHSFVDDTCVNCHMQQTPPPDVLAYNQGGSNHTFYASADICSRCHGDAFDADGVQNAVDAALLDLLPLIEDALLELIAEQTALGYQIDLDGEAMIADAAEITDLEFGEARGRQAITVTLTDGMTYGPFRLNDVEVVPPTPMEPFDLYDVADPVLIKAGWNWNLVNNDGSRGVHNPTFALTALDAARDALLAAAP